MRTVSHTIIETDVNYAFTLLLMTFYSVRKKAKPGLTISRIFLLHKASCVDLNKYYKNRRKYNQLNKKNILVII